MLEERIRRSAKKPPETKTAMTLRKKQSSPSHKEHGESKKHGTDLPPQQRGGAKGVAVEPRCDGLFMLEVLYTLYYCVGHAAEVAYLCALSTVTHEQSNVHTSVLPRPYTEWQ